MKALLDLLVFTALTIEREDTFAFGKWQTITAWLRPMLEAKVPGVGLNAWDVALVAAALVAALHPKTRKNRVPSFDWALAASLGALVAWCAFGLLRGGEARYVLMQVNALGRMYLLFFVLHATYRTRRDLTRLARVVLAAALYRAVACLWFYTFHVRGKMDPYPETMTDHDDSVPWAVACLGLAAFALVRPRLRTLLPAGLCGLILLVAIAINNRRVAWVEVAGGLAMVYLALPKGPVRRTIHRVALRAAPILVLYMALGWASHSPLFLPVQQLRSALADSNNPSNESRDIENMGLILTLKQAPIIGSGLGHQYTEVSTVYSAGMVTRFPAYRAIPHNAILGLVTLTGAVGFALIWTFPACASFLAARAARFARRPGDLALALVAFAAPFVYSVQAFGDMGLQVLQTNVILAVSMAAAARLAVITGAWPGRSARRSRTAAEVHSGPQPFASKGAAP